MGGTESLLLWALAYDPIVEGLEAATGTRCPTWVDDLSALAYGPSQSVRVVLFLLAAGHCAGLLVTGHRCEWISVRRLHPRVEAVLASFPVDVCREGGEVRIYGLPPAAVQRILDSVLGTGWGEDIRHCRGPCTCGLKTAMVPAHSLDAWQAAMAGGAAEINKRSIEDGDEQDIGSHPHG